MEGYFHELDEWVDVKIVQTRRVDGEPHAKNSDNKGRDLVREYHRRYLQKPGPNNGLAINSPAARHEGRRSKGKEQTRKR